MLKVTVAEVQRDIIKQLGIDLECQPVLRHAQCSTSTIANPFTALGTPLVEGNAATFGFKGVTATLARDGARRRDPHARRAEPDSDLRAKSASFLAGGEFPVVGGYQLRPGQRLCSRRSVQEIRRRLELHAAGTVRGTHQSQVMTEVSELSNEGDAHSRQLVHSLAQDEPRRDHG
jgi:pilus assembly protein CpaC